jgi:hypothetical protein
MRRTQPLPLQYEANDPKRLLKGPWPGDMYSSFKLDGSVLWTSHPWERPGGSGGYLFPAGSKLVTAK